ncbi:MAG: ankyrin repeat domain-containing protein [Legionella sp.]|nr:ankyrin repeat domain-containing protein [Legionella sp.]
MLEKIPALVQENQFEQIQEIVQELKKTKKYKWHISPNNELYIEQATRDALLLGHYHIVEYFIKKGVSPTIWVPVAGDPSQSEQLFMVAFKRPDILLPCIKLFVKNVRDNTYSERVISAAIIGKHNNVVEHLLQNGQKADGYFLAEGVTFLGKAALDGNSELVDILIKHGADLEEAVRKNYSYFKKRKLNIRDAIEHSIEKKETYSGLEISSMSNSNKEGWGNYFKTSLAEYREKTLKAEQSIKKYERMLVELKETYRHSLILLLDNAIGMNFRGYSRSVRSYFQEEKDELAFLGDNVADICLILSIDGFPITKQRLISGGIGGAGEAIVSPYTDLDKISEPRRNTILEKVNKVIETRGNSSNDLSFCNFVPLDVAIVVNDEKTVKVRAAHRVEPEELTRALKLATEARYNRFMELLIPITPLHEQLHMAVKNGDFEKVKKLHTLGADLNKRFSKITPLSLAAKLSILKKKPSINHTKIITFLLENGANPNLGPCSPLHYAMKVGSIDAVTLLLPHVNKSDVKMEQLHYGDPPKFAPWYLPHLSVALASSAWREILTLLIDQYQIDINLPEYDGSTLIQGAIIYLVPATIINENLVFLAKAKKTSKFFDKSEIKSAKKCLASYIERLGCLDFLMDNGADVQVQDEYGNTPLHNLISGNNLSFKVDGVEQCVNKLIAKGLDVNSQNNDGYTLLHIAASLKNLDAVLFLIKNGANTRLKDDKGRTPLDIATENDNVEIKNALVNAETTVASQGEMDMEISTPTGFYNS